MCLAPTTRCAVLRTTNTCLLLRRRTRPAHEKAPGGNTRKVKHASVGIEVVKKAMRAEDLHANRQTIGKGRGLRRMDRTGTDRMLSRHVLTRMKRQVEVPNDVW
jgi:hypothetical protein